MSGSSQPTAEPWTVQRVLRFATDDLRQRGFDSPRLDAELLLCKATGLDRIGLILNAERELSPNELDVCRELLKRRRAAEPIAYLLGQREFYGLPFEVDRNVLIPRPETETLVELVLERTQERAMHGRLLDLCTGSGCVAIAFAKHRPTWAVTGVDISEAAIAVARRNSLRLGVQYNLRLLAGDLSAPLSPNERFDVITANAPYIPTGEIPGLMDDVRHHEPHLALDGGEDGLCLVRRVIEAAKQSLEPGGLLALEVGDDQALEVSRSLGSADFERVERHRDCAGRERVVSAQRTHGSTPR